MSDTAVELKKMTIKIQTATPEALAPYGTVLGYNPAVEPLPIDFYDGAAKVRRVAKFESTGDTEMPIVTVKRRPLKLRWMERHFLHTQGFVSLGAKPFIGVFAPPTDGELPEIDKVEAFLFDGTAGFLMHKGTWHDFPFVLVDDTSLLVILTAQATDGLVRDNVIQDEAFSEDLDKKDLQARLGLSIDLVF
jgi:ureidoglycolate lyase